VIYVVRISEAAFGSGNGEVMMETVIPTEANVSIFVVGQFMIKCLLAVAKLSSSVLLSAPLTIYVGGRHRPDAGPAK